MQIDLWKNDYGKKKDLWKKNPETHVEFDYTVLKILSICPTTRNVI